MSLRKEYYKFIREEPPLNLDLILKQRTTEFRNKRKAKSQQELALLRRRVERLKISKQNDKKESIQEKAQRDFISYLPDELLEEILNNLKDPKDLANCSRASIVFRSILGPPKLEWTFHEVLPCLALYLDFTDLLKCRRVCHSWKQAVDYLLLAELTPFQNGSSYKARLTRNRLISKLENAGGHVKFVNVNSSIQAINQFSSEMGFSSGGNCFVGRRLTISNFSGHGRVPLAMSFLIRFGKFIWNLSLGLPGSCRKFNDLLRNSLFHIPNVRKLHLMISSAASETPEVCRRANRAGKEQRHNNYGLSSFFPKLPHLISLKLDEVPPEIFNFLPEDYWKNLLMLELPDTVFESIFWTNRNILKTGLQNLTELHIFIEKWESLEKLLVLRCPKLEMICVDIKNDKIGLHQVIQVLQHFGKLLHHVQIKWPGNNKVITPSEVDYNLGLSLSSPPGLSLPHLQILELRNPTESLNFLLFLHSIQYLEIEMTHPSVSSLFGRKVKSSELIQVHGYVHSMYKSNIWWLLPKLTECKIFGVLPSAVFQCSRGDENESVKGGVHRHYTRSWYKGL